MNHYTAPILFFALILGVVLGIRGFDLVQAHETRLENIVEVNAKLVEKLDAVALNGSARFSGHEDVACTSGGTALPTMQVADANGTLHGSALKVTVHATSADIVRIVSKNGAASSKGTAFCTVDPCVRSMTLPTSTSLWTCVADGATATLTLLGVR